MFSDQASVDIYLCIVIRSFKIKYCSLVPFSLYPPGIPNDGMRLMFAYSALGLGVLALFGGKLSLLFLDSAESAAVRDQIGLLAQQFLVWNASCYFLLTLVNVLRFLIQGVGFTQQAVFAGVFETIARCFVGFAVVRWIGYTAICLANPAAWLLADCFLVPIYFHDMHLLQRRFAQRRAEA